MRRKINPWLKWISAGFGVLTNLIVLSCQKEGDFQNSIDNIIEDVEYIEIEKKEYKVPASSSFIQIAVNTNVNVVCSIADHCKSWITYDGNEDDRYLFNILQNDTAQERLGIIVFSYGEISELVTIIQEPISPSIILSKDMFISSYVETEIELEVNHNIPISFTSADADWIEYTITKEGNKDIYHFSIHENDTNIYRSADFMFNNSEFNLYVPFIIEQTPVNSYYVNPGSLHEMIETQVIQIGDELILYGTLNNDDFMALNIIQTLRTLNISNCTCEGHVIPANAFENNYNLSKVELPQDILIIEDNAFKGCISIESISIPMALTEIKSSAFENCLSLESVIIPSDSKLQSLGYNSFKNCNVLVSIILPNSLESIEEYCFRGCTSLTKLALPESISHLGMGLLQDCKGLKACVIPINIERIPDYMFSGCSMLSNVVIPESIVEIGQMAFQDCVSLETICLPNSIKSIGQHAFSGCSLKEIGIPPLMEYLGWYIFEECPFVEVTIPEKVKSINRAFRSCRNLRKVCCLAPIPPVIDEFAFSNMEEISVYVRKEYFEFYKNDSKWGTFFKDRIFSL